MAKLTRRPARPADANGLTYLFGHVEEVAPIGLETQLTAVKARLAHSHLDLDRDTLVVIDGGGQLVAYAEAADMGVGQGVFRIRLTAAMHSHADHELRVSVHAWLVERAAQLRRERRPDLPGLMAIRCAAAEPERHAFLLAAGFRGTHQHQYLVRRLDLPVHAPTPPDVIIHPYRTEHDEATWSAHNNASADNPAALLPDRSAWPRHAVGLPTFMPGASFIASTPDGQVVGFALSLRRDDEAGPDAGTASALLQCLGTTAPWRRRGLGSALVGRAVTAYRAAGLDLAEVVVSDANPDAGSLYARLGFTDTYRGYSILMADLS